nr:unnamed protein product [Spirometra erinaceieuropaei]
MATADRALSEAWKVYNSAYKSIEAAVVLEESRGSVQEALKHYKVAITALDRALSSPAVKGSNSQDMMEVRSKMKKYRELAAERCVILSRPRSSTASSSTRKIPPPAAKRSIAEAKGTASEKLKKYDQALVGKILDDVWTDCSQVSFDDIAGNEEVKEHLREAVIYPALRPELFTGLRSPVRGILLFGPPGNGKTMLAKAVATESKCVFLNISAASILSKWVGDSEKYVKVLFAVARALEPAIIFLDEVDALLIARKEDNNNVGRRVLTQFLAEVDGAGSGEERILVLGATNRPQELDDAALRRFPKRLLVPMPNLAARTQLLNILLHNQPDIKLSASDISRVAQLTDGYSASDLTQLAKDAALGPIRELKPGQLQHIPKAALRPVMLKDFTDSLQRIRPSLTSQSLQSYAKWNSSFGENRSAETASAASSSFLSKLFS